MPALTRKRQRREELEDRTDQEFARIRLLLKAARLEAVNLQPDDGTLRREIMDDLDALLKELRRDVTAVLSRHGIDVTEAT